MSSKNQCKVKIGSAYEPKWFERRQTNGWYSGKNPPLDDDAMKLQNMLLGGDRFAKKTPITTVLGMSLGIILLFGFYVWLFVFN